MSRNVASFGALMFVAVGAAVLTRMVGAAAPVAEPPESDLQARLQRLEARVPEIDRSLATTGARLGAAALATAHAAAGDSMDDEGTPEGDAREKQREAERAEKEKRHYDRLDDLVSLGSGAEGQAQLRANILASSSLSKDRLSAPLEVRSIHCGESVCRVEIQLANRVQMIQAAHVLGQGMAGLSMPPASEGKGTGTAVYYLGAPGHQLPDVQP